MSVPKINPDIYVGDTGKQLKDIKTNADNIASNKTNISSNETNIENIKSKMDYDGIKSINQAIMGYATLGSNPNCDLIGRPGLYPLYSYDAQLTNGSTYTVAWGCLIVIPYTYNSNNNTAQDWLLQIIIGATGWDSSSGVDILTRRCNYYGGWAKWNKIH